jgi:hypothetical protein
LSGHFILCIWHLFVSTYSAAQLAFVASNAAILA